MAITRDKKNTLVTELVDLFNNAKGSAAAAYTGLSVADLQLLRSQARDKNIVIKVVKNRLVRVALGESKDYKKASTDLLTGQLVYAFSSEDEVAPAQLLASFAKSHPELQLVTGFDSSGNALDTATVVTLANLPSKDQLRGQLVSVLAAPLSQFMSVANGAQRSMAQVLSMRVEQL